MIEKRVPFAIDLDRRLDAEFDIPSKAVDVRTESQLKRPNMVFNAGLLPSMSR